MGYSEVSGIRAEVIRWFGICMGTALHNQPVGCMGHYMLREGEGAGKWGRRKEDERQKPVESGRLPRGCSGHCRQ